MSNVVILYDDIDVLIKYLYYYSDSVSYIFIIIIKLIEDLIVTWHNSYNPCGCFYSAIVNKIAKAWAYENNIRNLWKDLDMITNSLNAWYLNIQDFNKI